MKSKKKNVENNDSNEKKYIIIIAILVAILIFGQFSTHTVVFEYSVDNIEVKPYVYYEDNKKIEKNEISFNIYSQTDKRDKLPKNSILRFKCHNKETNKETYEIVKADNYSFNIIHNYPNIDGEPINSAILSNESQKIDYCNFVGIEFTDTIRNNQ